MGARIPTALRLTAGLAPDLLIFSNYPLLTDDPVELHLADFVGARRFPRMNTFNSRARWLWIALTAFTIAGVGVFFFPALIISPFRYQNPRALLWAMAMRARAPVVSLLRNCLLRTGRSLVAEFEAVEESGLITRGISGYIFRRDVSLELFRVDVPSR